MVANKRIKIESQEKVLAELESLRTRLERAESTLRAIHTGDVDAIIIHTDRGERVYSFEEAERPYRILIEEMSQGAVTLNLKGEILYSNQFFSTLVGAPVADLVGKSFVELIHADSKKNWSDHLSIEGGSMPEIFLVGPNDGKLPVGISVSRLMTKSELDLGLIVTDLREQRRIEQALRERAEREAELRAVAERSYQEAAVASRLKDEFLATLSHELRTPLNAILGYSDILLEQTAGNDDLRQSAEIIHRNAFAQTRIVDDLLDVSAITKGQLCLTSNPVAIQPLVDSAIKSIRLAAEAKGIEIGTTVDAKEPILVLGDSTRLLQIFWNLLSNAVKFTPTGGSIEIAVVKCKNAVEIVIKDTGEGIAPEFLPYVFDRFRQEDGSLKRRYGGLGLGLSIVRYLVEAHGGSISVASGAKHKGTSFTVTLPILGSSLATSHRPAAARTTEV